LFHKLTTHPSERKKSIRICSEIKPTIYCDKIKITTRMSDYIGGSLKLKSSSGGGNDGIKK